MPQRLPLGCSLKAVSQLLRPVNDREVWFSLAETTNTYRSGLHQLRNCYSEALAERGNAKVNLNGGEPGSARRGF
jgi:hypothetical protein